MKKKHDIKVGYKIFYTVTAGLLVLGQVGQQLELMTILWIIPWIAVAYACWTKDAGLAYGWNIINIIWCALLIAMGGLAGEEFYVLALVGLIFLFPVSFAQGHFVKLKAEDAV